MSRATRAVASVVLALAALAGRAAAQDLATLFPLEAEVYPSAPGLARLSLPAPVLERCAPDLSDVRLFDGAGQEVPYVIDPGLPSGSERVERVVADAVVNDLEREEMPREGGKALTRETYRVALPAKDAPSGSWTLVATSGRPRYVRAVEVLGVARDGSTVPLVPRASLLRLGQRLVDRDRIALPAFDGEEIVVTISGEEGFFLEPVLRFEADRTLVAADAIERPLTILSRRTTGGRTVLEVERPPGLVAGRLRIASATPAFDRAVEVRDVASDGSATPIGRGRVLRAPAAADAALAERLDVAIEPARRAHMQVEIADGDSPPLAELRVAAVVSAPAILFALPAAAPDEAAGVLRFGGGRAYPPRYDVADLFRDALAASGEVLADPARIPAARLGPVRANPRFDPAPALAPVMHAGAQLDPDAWRWHRTVVIPASPEGLVAVRLAPEDVTHAEPSRADLRLVDARRRQWPFLVAPAAERDDVALEITGPEREDGRSRWRLAPAAAPLTLDRLVLHTARPALGRRYRILAKVDGDERVLDGGILAQDLRRPAPLLLSFPAARVDALELEVEDGDDAPLEITRALAPVALPTLLVAAPPGNYVLLAGNPDASAPRYEIERARHVVAGLRSVPATLGEGGENESWRGTPGGTALRHERLQRGAIWTAIVLAVLILGALTLRAARGPASRR
ncbi:MAG: hypothetical protein AB1689_24910 [Thermodesulfobacteriota bacterium]